MDGATRQREAPEGAAVAPKAAVAALPAPENPFRRAAAEAALLRARLRDYERLQAERYMRTSAPTS